MSFNVALAEGLQRDSFVVTSNVADAVPILELPIHVSQYIVPQPVFEFGISL